MKLTKLLLLVVAFIMVARFGYAAETEAAKANEDGIQERQSDPRKMAGGFAREQALGGTSSVNGVYDFNPYLKNDAYMLINPAYVNTYKNYVWGNFDDTQTGNYTRTFAGANFAIDAVEGLTLGILVNTKDAAAVTFSSDFDAGFTSALTGVSGAFHPSFPTINNTLSFLAGYQINPNLGVGLQVYTGSKSSETKSESGSNTVTITQDISVFGLDLGGVYDDNNGLKVDLSGRLRFNSASDKAEITNQPTREIKLDGGTEMDFNARAFVKLSQKVDLVPVAQFYHLNWKPTISPAATDPVNTPYKGYEATDNVISVGAGLNVKLNKALVVGGVRFAQYSYETKLTNVGRTPNNNQTVKNTYTDLPIFNLGVEYYALNWLTLRLGYAKGVYTGETKTTTTPPSGSSTTVTTTTRGNVYGNTDNNDNVTAGVGFHFGSFNMNVAVSNTFLTNGPYLLSGNSGWNSGSGSLFALFSANYSW